jgi:hypothetical protein
LPGQVKDAPLPQIVGEGEWADVEGDIASFTANAANHPSAWSSYARIGRGGGATLRFSIRSRHE